MSTKFLERVRNAASHFGQTEGIDYAIMRIINKTPARHAVRALVDAWNFRLRRERQDLANFLTETAATECYLTELRERGYVVLRSKDIALDSNILAEIRNVARAYDEHDRRDPNRYKGHYEYLLDPLIEKNGLTTDNPFVRASMTPELVSIVTRYLGELPALRYVLLARTRGDSAQPDSSQLWHFDFDDVRMVKFFIYLSDVESPDAGPVTLFPRSVSRELRKGLIPPHMTDNDVETILSIDSAVPIYGKRLTSFLADTSKVCHMGGRVRVGNERILYTAMYQAVPSIYPGRRSQITIGRQALSEIENAIVAI